MKLQNLTVIFAAIMIPITLVLSAYIGTQIDTASLQQSYDTTLLDATHDAVVAFELNTENDDYSTNADSIRRDIQASINTFASSLASGLGTPGANSEYIMPYIPAILVTLYDGYYIYSPSEYTYPSKEIKADGTLEDVTKTGYTHILKPYVYYSATYEDGSGDYIVVNYSLDNYISLYGKIGNEVIAKSGYLTTQDERSAIASSEELKEYIKCDNGYGTFKYIYVNGKKIYNYYGSWYTIRDSKLVPYIGAINNFGDTSAIQYKNDSDAFMSYITGSIGGKSISSIVTPSHCVEAKENGNSSRILEQDPEDQTSSFNEHKRKIIRQSIQNNLNNAMAIYNANSGSMGTNASFRMPKLSETDWEKILTNVNFVTFMQGLPVGLKTYNNYSIVTSTNNKQYVDPESIFFVDTTTNQYHTIYGVASEGIDANNVVGYKSQDFRKVKYEVNTGTGETAEEYYYRRGEYACYNCKISLAVEERELQQILNENPTLKQKYYRALARERYNLNKATAIKAFMTY